MWIKLNYSFQHHGSLLFVKNVRAGFLLCGYRKSIKVQSASTLFTTTAWFTLFQLQLFFITSPIIGESRRDRSKTFSEAIYLEETAIKKNEEISMMTSHLLKLDQIDDILDTYHQLKTIDIRPMEDIIQYDELGLPK